MEGVHVSEVRHLGSLKVLHEFFKTIVFLFQIVLTATGLSTTPKRPGLSLAGVQLRVSRPHRWGFPCSGRFPSTDMPMPLPRWDRWVHLSLLPHLTAAFPEKLTGRLPQLGLSRPAQRSLVFRPASSLDRPRRSVTSEASTDLLPPPPLRLLPAGATRRRMGITPIGNRRLSRRTVL